MTLLDEAWIRAPRIGVAVDLDGTLIAHAPTPADAVLDEEARALLDDLSRSPGVSVAVISGRPRDALEAMLGAAGALYLVAEHGAFRRLPGGPWSLARLSGTEPDAIEAELRAIAARHRGALIERKRWSVCLHHRTVPARERDALVIEATHAIERFCAAHPEHELLEGSFVLEVRHRGANKGAAMAWLRASLPTGTPLIVIGDDETDEDAFACATERDLAIRIGGADRPTRAGARLRDVAAARAVLAELAGARRSGARPRRAEIALVEACLPRASLVVVSNRLPDAVSPAGETERARNVGGLVSGLAPALQRHEGVWLGWSGAHAADPHALAIDRAARPARAAFDFAPRWQALFYNGFANRALWPIFHSFPGRARYAADEWRAYLEVNETFAEHAVALAGERGAIWAHDYHLLMFGAALRRRAHRGPLGLFLHIPFPGLDLFETIPWAKELLDGMLAFDLVGMHTRRYVENFRRCAIEIAGARPSEAGVILGGRTVRLGAFPLGIDPEPFAAQDEQTDPEIIGLHAALRGRALVLGVDRLDYTKGILERLHGFDHFLSTRPEWRGRVTFVQVAVPSRSDVPEYSEQRREIETAVGRINGEHGEAHWVPVRYVYRSYSRAQLARLYRAADVGWVTPLRDGMNLVAKEYVAAQDAARPGVLVLSRFCGAAEELDAAVLTTPYDRESMARDLARALSMPVAERADRHRALLARVRSSTPAEWADRFVTELLR